jgi:hypothetical protein
MVDGLQKTVLLFFDVRVKDADGTIIGSTQQEIVPRRVKIDSSDFVVDLGVLPPNLVLPPFPAGHDSVSLARNPSPLRLQNQT